jgi:ElaB/YqjD/DUF883 family membrane-anchored ribosome-binding protein
MTTPTRSANARGKLSDDMKAVLADAEELLKATAGQGGDKNHEVRSRIEATLRSAQSWVEEMEDTTVENIKAAATATDHYVHENPWPSIGIAAGVGLVLGWLMGRK